MFRIIVSIFVLGFGLFLKTTNNPGFASSKKLAWVFIIVGLLSLIFKVYNYYQNGAV